MTPDTRRKVEQRVQRYVPSRSPLCVELQHEIMEHYFINGVWPEAVEVGPFFWRSVLVEPDVLRYYYEPAGERFLGIPVRRNSSLQTYRLIVAPRATPVGFAR